MEKEMNFLSFICNITIPKGIELIVGDFYKTGGIVPMSFGDNFTNWILNPMKEMKVSLDTETSLKKFLLKKKAYDTEIQSDFTQKPVIPLKVFMAQLKAMIEAQPNGEFKQDGLDNSGKANIFNVDLSEINPNLGVVVLYVFRYGDVWYCRAGLLGYDYHWHDGDSFFSPVTI